MNIEFKGLDLAYNEVKKFQKAFGHPYKDKPTPMSIERALKRADWMDEEIDEFIRGCENGDVVEQADAIIDLIYFALGTLVEIGVKPQKIFEIVQEANMSKLFPDGKPRYRESDGKVIKPEGWEAPEPKIKEEIEKQKRGEY